MALLFQGVASGNGGGDPVSEVLAKSIMDAFHDVLLLTNSCVV
jgi:hypothetical protein